MDREEKRDQKSRERMGRVRLGRKMEREKTERGEENGRNKRLEKEKNRVS